MTRPWARACNDTLTELDMGLVIEPVMAVHEAGPGVGLGDVQALDMGYVLGHELLPSGPLVTANRG